MLTHQIIPEIKKIIFFLFFLRELNPNRRYRINPFNCFVSRHAPDFGSCVRCLEKTQLSLTKKTTKTADTEATRKICCHSNCIVSYQQIYVNDHRNWKYIKQLLYWEGNYSWKCTDTKCNTVGNVQFFKSCYFKVYNYEMC